MYLGDINSETGWVCLGYVTHFFSHFSYRHQVLIGLTWATTIESEIYTVIHLDSTVTAEQQQSTNPRTMACYLTTAAPNTLNVLQNFRVT
jgi:hypothetical protein